MFLLALLAISSVAAMPSISVVANVRGKKYDVSAETVEEFSQQVEGLAGIEAAAQSVLFRGKVLSPTDNLEEVGITTGDILNVVKGRKRQANFAEQDAATAKSGLEDELQPNAGNAAKDAAMNNINVILDDIEGHFSPEKLESSRLQLLQNMDQYEKMMPGFRAQAEAIATDPVKWQEAMMKAKESMLKLKEMRDTGKMSPDQLFPEGSPFPPSAADNRY